jgi:pyruvate dehydrogenase E2 component (dihydrolipoamide acetyltransferase)
MANEIKLPKLKENVESVEVQEVLVSAGQTVEKDQPLLVVNADKSTMEVPAPFAGKVVSLNVKPGQELKIGQVYCVLEGGNGEVQAPAPRKEPAREEAVSPRSAPAKVAPPPPAPELGDGGVIPAGPGARWLARKLGVDLRSVHGSGPKGRITEDDVKSAFGGAGVSGGAVQAPPLPNFAQFGEIATEPLNRTRKLTAKQMSLAWSLIPHVTQHDVADVTDLEAFRKGMEARGTKLTVTAFALKACAQALRQFPQFNSSLDLQGGQLILKKYVHIGVAVDTPGGLLVPVIRDVDKKGVEQLARELVEVSEKARAGKADMSGGCFTITNLGGIGGTGFTPIVNWPEVAILGMSRSRLQPVIRDGQVVPRLHLPLSLSYDHRVIDGAAAARFTRRVAEMLENPWLMLL